MHLNYKIDENDLESQRALDQVTADAPKPSVVMDMQNNLARILQSQTPPQPNSDGANTAQGINNNPAWS